MKKILTSISLFVCLCSMPVTAQTIRQQIFDGAYQVYPAVPKPLLEVLAYSASRWQNIMPDENDYHAGPPRFGLFALVEDGKGYFSNTLLLVCAKHGIKPAAFKADEQLQVMAVAHYLSDLCKQYKVKSIRDIRPVLDQFTEIPANNTVSQFARELNAYEIFYQLNTGVEINDIQIKQQQVDAANWFNSDTYQLLQSPRLLIDGNEVTDGNQTFNKGNTMQTVTATDYPPALWVTSPNYSSRNATTISAVAIHTMEGSYAGSIAWFQNTAANASAHYMVRSSDGQVTQMVREADKAWHVGTENTYTIGIEHEGYVAQTGWYTTAMYNSSASLAKDICADNNISTTACYNGASGSTVNVLASSVKIKGHQHYPNQTHTDPGINWNWPLYYNLLNNAPCNASTTLNESFISTSFANLNWSAVTGASAYTLEWKTAAATTWNSISSSVNYKTITGLAASTAYNWRVKTQCSNGGVSAYSAVKTFTTQASCWDANEPNNIYTSPSTYNLSNNFTYGKICTTGDIDFFRVTTTATQNITFKLQTLPKNYNLETFTGAGFYLAGSYATGTADESVTLYSAPAGSYLFRVYGASATDYDALNDYRLQIVLAAPTTNSMLTQNNKEETITTDLLSVYPNPAADKIVLRYTAPVAATAVIEVFDNMNQRVLIQQQTVNKGAGQLQLNCSGWKTGIYFIQMNTGNKTDIKKVIVAH